MREHGDVAVVARAHTEASIQRMRISGFDDTRCACSQDYYYWSGVICVGWF